MDEDQKRRLKASFKANERRQLEASIPMSVPELKEFLSHLNRPDVSACDHTLRNALLYMKDQGLDPDKIVPWLREHGGFCDCEIIYNVYNDFGDIVGWHLDDA